MSYFPVANVLLHKVVPTFYNYMIYNEYKLFQQSVHKCRDITQK